MMRLCHLLLVGLAVQLVALAPAPADAKGKLRQWRKQRQVRKQVRREFRKLYWTSRQARKHYRAEKKVNRVRSLRFRKWLSRGATLINASSTVGLAASASPWALATGGLTAMSARNAFRNNRRLKQAKFRAKSTTLMAKETGTLGQNHRPRRGLFGWSARRAARRAQATPQPGPIDQRRQLPPPSGNPAAFSGVSQ
jgi:hypothetical protein